MHDSPSSLSDEALSQMIFQSRAMTRSTQISTADVAERVSKFSELFNSLPVKPEGAALLYRSSERGSTICCPIGTKLVVGRAPQQGGGATMIVDDDEISRVHFKITLSDSFYILTDLESTNGTWVNGTREKTALLIAGATIKAGKTFFVFTGN